MKRNSPLAFCYSHWYPVIHQSLYNPQGDFTGNIFLSMLFLSVRPIATISQRLNIRRMLLWSILLALGVPVVSQSDSGRDNFVHLKDAIPNIKYEIRYAGKNNFLGRPVKGYESAEALMTKEAAATLKKVQTDLNTQGFGLKVFDAYRPQRAVNDFIAWAKIPGDTLTKRQFYPDLPKNRLFELGYIASRSGHSRGSTIDLTVIDLKTGKEIDMGGPYDFFGEISHHDYTKISSQQKENRLLLRNAMEKHGFNAYEKEWWHYTLKNEPYPETYFDFPVSQ